MASSSAIDANEEAMFTKLAPKARGGVDYSFTKRLATPRETSPSCVTTHNDKLSLAQPVRSAAVHPPPTPTTHAQPHRSDPRLPHAGVAARHLSV